LNASSLTFSFGHYYAEQRAAASHLVGCITQPVGSAAQRIAEHQFKGVAGVPYGIGYKENAGSTVFRRDFARS